MLRVWGLGFSALRILGFNVFRVEGLGFRVCLSFGI